jgi:phage terminase small subunit
MTSAKPSQKKTNRQLSDTEIQKLEKIAFANIDDFARFEPDGSVHIFDYDKAHDIGAKIKIKTRLVGRGKNAREMREVSIRMPDKLPALIKLGEHLGLFPARRKTRAKSR